MFSNNSFVSHSKETQTAAVHDAEGRLLKDPNDLIVYYFILLCPLRDCDNKNAIILP